MRQLEYIKFKLSGLHTLKPIFRKMVEVVIHNECQEAEWLVHPRSFLKCRIRITDTVALILLST